MRNAGGGAVVLQAVPERLDSALKGPRCLRASPGEQRVLVSGFSRARQGWSAPEAVGGEVDGGRLFSSRRGDPEPSGRYAAADCQRQTLDRRVRDAAPVRPEVARPNDGPVLRPGAKPGQRDVYPARSSLQSIDSEPTL